MADAPSQDPDKNEAADALALPATAFSPFRYPVFRAIWIANLFSNLGSTMQAIGAAWLMTDLTTSHTLVALVQASVTLPIMLIGVFAGAIADNFDRRLVMLASQVGMLVVSSALALLTWLGVISPVLLLAFTLSVGIGTALNSPAWQASVRQQVPRGELPQAIALNSVSFNIARSIGPALGGLLMGLTDVSMVFLVNALSYLGLIGVLLWWRPAPRMVERRAILPAIGVGIRYCATNRNLRRILMRGFAIGFGLAAFQALIPAVVSEQLEGDEMGFGTILGLFGIGSILCAPAIAPLRRRLDLEGILALGVIMQLIGLSWLAEVHTIEFALPAAFICGASWVMLLATINTAVQMRSPDEILGRCLSIYQAVTFGGMATGSYTWGWVADTWSLPAALHVASVFIVGSFAILRVLARLPRSGEGLA